MASSPIQSPKRTQPIVAGASPLVLPVTPLHPSTNKTTLPIVVNQPISVPNSPKAYSVTDPRAGILCCPPPELDPGIIEFVYGTYTTYENTPGSASIYVQRINGSDGISYVNYTSSNGTARNPTNYTGSTGTLKWDNGELGIKHFDIKINNIAGWNPDVAFSASLYNAINSSLGLDLAIINILNVDIKTPGCFRFTQATQSVLESVSSASLFVERISGSDDISSVIYVTQNGTAIAGTNYGTTNGSLVWAHGESGSKSFIVPIYNDGVYTPTLYFSASLTSSVNSTLNCGFTREIVYIENITPPAPGTMSFVSGAYSVNEPSEASSHTSSVNFYVYRLGGYDGTISCSCATSNGNALAGVDYKATSSKFIWVGNEVLKTFTVEVYRNPNINYDIGFTASLSNPYVGALGTVSKSIATIVNDGNPGTIRFQDSSYSILEPNGAPSLTSSLYFTIQRVWGSDGISSASFSTSNGSATAFADYKTTSSVFVWPHGDLTWRTYSVEVYRNTLKNEDIGFTASLSNFFNSTAGAITKSIGTILNTLNPSTMSFVEAAYSELEPSVAPYTSSISFIVKRTGGDGISSASCATSNGSATGGTDYKITSSVFVWANGDLENKVFEVEIYRNQLKNYDIGFTASLSNPYNGIVGTISKSIGTIIDVGNYGVIEFVDASYITYENDVYMIFEITRSGGKDGKVSASFTTIDGTAISGSLGVGDYRGRALPLIWDNGDGTKRYVSIIIDGEDGVIEPDKYFSGSLSNPIGGAVLGLSQSTVTIIDTTTIVQYVDNLFVGVNGAQSTQTHLELLGYTGSTVTIDITSQAGDVFYATPPAKGIEAVGQVFTPNTNTFTWTPAEGNATKTEWTVSYASAWKDPNVEPESYICSRSITSWTNCVTGSNDKANVYLYNFDDEADMVLNVIRLQEPLETLQIDLYGTTSTTVYAENFNGVNVKSTASYTTVNGTAIAGTDYKTVSGVVMFNTGVLENPVDNFPSAAIDLEIYPTCAGKYFYVQLSSPIPFTGTSIAYPSKVMITGSWDVSHVTFRESSIIQLATSQFEAGVPFNIEIDRTDNLTDAISIVATIHDDYNTDTFFYPNGSYSNTLSWMAGEGGIKILTVNGASVNSMLENGYFTMSLYKVNPTDKVIFSPTSSLYITYEVP